jgi:hypothetical protein
VDIFMIILILKDVLDHHLIVLSIIIKEHVLTVLMVIILIINLTVLKLMHSVNRLIQLLKNVPNVIKDMA